MASQQPQPITTVPTTISIEAALQEKSKRNKISLFTFHFLYFQF